MSIALFNKSAQDIARKITTNYSTSFSLGIKLLAPKFRSHIFNIYAMVRQADEIVDTLHEFNKAALLEEFRQQTYRAIEEKISTNPILQAFQLTARKYNIGKELIEPFFESMKEDLETSKHNYSSYKEYIYGSAEVVGLMCLRVFTSGNNDLFAELKPYAQSLGAAFQKVNFLRDAQSDMEERGRTYFPETDFENFNLQQKERIIKDIKADFDHALIGIKQLPASSRRGVYVAYTYYIKLLAKIERTPPARVMQTRIRIPNYSKVWLLAQSVVSDSMMSTSTKI